MAVGAAVGALLVPAALAQAAGQVQSALAKWGRANPQTTALVVRLDGPATTQIASFKPEAARIPASTMKLVTTAAALIELGPDYRFTTPLLAGPATQVTATAITGPLYLRGAGDPLLATRAYARRYLGGTATDLATLVVPLRRAGIRRVDGPIVADEGLFDARRTGPGWPARYSAYSAPLSALVTNHNYAGDAQAQYLANPPIAAAQRLRAALRGVGIRQRGRLGTGRTPSGARALAMAVSPPLSRIVRAMNLASDNFIAETLAKDVGAYGGARGTTAAGTAKAAELLAGQGVPPGAGDRLVDGSGLSRANRLSANTLVRIIAAADRDPTWGAALIGSLARGGEGTLIRRFLRGPARTRVRAKTGYIDGATALAGRVTSVNGTRYAFALVMNSWDISGAQALQNRVVEMLAAGREDPATR